MLWEWGAYFTKEAIEEGLDVKISTWARNAPNTMPSMAKSVANYANSQLIKMEAILEGYAEGIALDTDGNLSEGSGQNIFIVRDGVIHTPPVGSSILSGITRDSVVTHRQGHGLRGAGAGAAARDALRGRRSVLRGHGRRGDAHQVGGQDQGRAAAAAGRSPRPSSSGSSHIVRGDAPDTHGWLQYLETPQAAASGSSTRR